MDCKKAVTVFENSPIFVDFLREDMKTTGEIGLLLDKNGKSYGIQNGDVNGVSLNVPQQKDVDSFISIHTQPFTETESERDIKSTKYNNITASIILSQELFETTWDGKIIQDTDTGITEHTFSIVCDGCASAPQEEQYIGNCSIQW